MYYVTKTMEISGAHNLCLPYESKCTNLHGHNWTISVHCKSEKLNHEGMVIDFTRIKKLVSDTLDHQYLNEILDFNPTAENMAKWICDRVPFCYQVDIQESSGNIATYVKEED